MDDLEPETLVTLDKRRIEAEILKHVHDTLKEHHGKVVAEQTVAEAVRRSAVEQAGRFAAAVGRTDQPANLYRPPSAVDGGRRAGDRGA